MCLWMLGPAPKPTWARSSVYICAAVRMRSEGSTPRGNGTLNTIVKASLRLPENGSACAPVHVCVCVYQPLSEKKFTCELWYLICKPTSIIHIIRPAASVRHTDKVGTPKVFAFSHVVPTIPSKHCKTSGKNFSCSESRIPN